MRLQLQIFFFPFLPPYYFIDTILQIYDLFDLIVLHNMHTYRYNLFVMYVQYLFK